MFSPDNIKKSVLAGVLIAIGALFSIKASPWGYIVMGPCFSVGLFAVLMSGAWLFTGQLLSATHAVLEGKAGVSDMAKTLCLVWAGNLVGALTVAFLGYSCGVDAYVMSGLRALADPLQLFFKAILCNMLVCLAVHLYGRSDRSVASAAVVSLACVTAFVVTGGEHCVADMLYMPLGLMRGTVTVIDCVRVIGVATLGNTIGGTVFSWLVWER
jgi:formate/nitrite transporter FocA (FNT family)